MAAVLCHSVGTLCHGCVEAVAWPCKKGCECCGKSCDVVQDFICSPFVPYLTTTLALNIAPVLYGVRSLGACDNSAWLATNALLCAGHIVGAIYIVSKIQADEQYQEATAYAYTDAEAGNKAEDEQPEKKTPSEMLSKMFPPSASAQEVDGERATGGSMKRMGQVLCHDVGVAIYILVAGFWFVWQLFGMSQLKGQDDAAEGCDAQEWIITSLVCGFLYMVLVFCAFGCSLLCLR